MEINLEKEIKEASARIEKRQSEIKSDLNSLEHKIKKYSYWAWGFVWAGFGLSVFSIVFYIYRHNEVNFGLNLLGDFLGGSVASVWALAGLFLIYVAFLGQKQQLLNQQLELMYSQLEVKYTRLELAGQKEEMKLQNLTLQQQKFENTFFQLLNLFNSIVNSLDLRNRKTLAVTTTGRDCFKVFAKRLKNHLSTVLPEDAENNKKVENATLEQTIEAFGKLYAAERSDLSHYFRTYYHIIKFIDQSRIDSKKKYIAIARAQLSSYEQILLFYNCLHVHGKTKFKPLIEKYSLFKNIDESLLINQNHMEEYHQNAFN